MTKIKHNLVKIQIEIIKLGFYGVYHSQVKMTTLESIIQSQLHHLFPRNVMSTVCPLRMYMYVGLYLGLYCGTSLHT